MDGIYSVQPTVMAIICHVSVGAGRFVSAKKGQAINGSYTDNGTRGADRRCP